MQRLNENDVGPLLFVLKDLASKSARVLLVQRQLWEDGQIPGELRRTVDSNQIMFEYVPDGVGGWIDVSFGLLNFCVFVGKEGSIAIPGDYVADYEIVGRTVRFESSRRIPRLKTSLTFS